MKIKVKVSNTAYTSKQAAVNATKVFKKGGAITDMTLSVQQIAEKWLAGHSIAPASFGHGKAPINANWSGQQLFAIDFDNENGDKERVSGDYYVSFDEVLEMAKQHGLAPAFIYSSFSSTTDHSKFRMVFVLDQEVQSKELHTEVLARLYSVFVKNGLIVADTRCCDRGRVFYGGQKLLYSDYVAVITLPQIMRVDAKVLPGVCNLRNNHDKTGIRLADFIPVSMMHCTSVRGETTPAMTALIEGDPLKLRDVLLHNDVDITNIIDKENTSNVHAIIDPYKVIRHLPLHLILGVPLNASFRCIMHGHEDQHPSAIVQQFKDGSYAYFCHGCYGGGTGQTLINLILEATGCRVPDTVKFVEIALGIELQTDHQRRCREQCENALNFIQSPAFRTDKWEPLYRYMSSRRLLGHYRYYLEQAILFCDAQPIVGEGVPTFYEAVRTTAFRMNDPAFYYCTGIGKNSVHSKRNSLVDIGLLGKCSISEHSTFIKAKEYQSKNAQQYHTEFLFVPSLSEEVLEYALQQIEEAKGRGERTRYRSRASIAKSRGNEAADHTYAQDTGKNISKYNKDFISYMFRTTDELVKKGWTTEDEIVAEIARKTKYTGVKWRVGQFRPLLVNGEHYKLQPLNKELRLRLNVPDSIASRKKIIFPVQHDV